LFPSLTIHHTYSICGGYLRVDHLCRLGHYLHIPQRIMRDNNNTNNHMMVDQVGSLSDLLLRTTTTSNPWDTRLQHLHLNSNNHHINNNPSSIRSINFSKRLNPVRSGIRGLSRIAIGRLLYVIFQLKDGSTLMIRHIRLLLYPCLIRNNTNLLYQVHTLKPTIRHPDCTISTPTQVSPSQHPPQRYRPQDGPSQAQSCLKKCHHRPCPTCHSHHHHQ
jgi:hypothetical protein